MKPPIFIIGNPRSGTTLLRLMLTCHKNIVVAPECGFAVWWHEKYKLWRSAGGQDDVLACFIEDLFNSKKFETWRLARDELQKFLARRQPASYADAVSAVYEFYAQAQGRAFTRWGDKNNFHVRHVPALKKLFPAAQFVHIVRDGRNVACSYKSLHAAKFDSPYAPRLPGDVVRIAEEWRANLQAARTGFDTIGWKDVYEVRFEDLILDTERTLIGLCAFLGEGYDATMIQYSKVNRDRELEPKEVLQWKAKTLQPPMRTEVTRYLTELTTNELRQFEAVAGDMLRQYHFLK